MKRTYLPSRAKAIFLIMVMVINSRGSEEGTQASGEERFQGQEEEEVEQTTKQLDIFNVFLNSFGGGGGGIKKQQHFN